jgi:nickel/cobalt transporter (NicO) family protein
VTRTAFLLFVSSCSTAIIHALIPDHWLPFVLISRVERWSEERAAALAGMAGALHVLVSLLAGGAAILLGSTTVESLAARTGRSLGFLGGVLLVVFGAVYGIWRHRREARSHPRTDRPEGDPRPHVHAHGHLLERWFHGTLTARALVLVIGISPCALLVPILLAAGTESPLAVLASAAGFALCTVATMVGITIFAMRGMRRIDLPFFARYGDLISGALVSAIGVMMMLHDV